MAALVEVGDKTSAGGVGCIRKESAGRAEQRQVAVAGKW